MAKLKLTKEDIQGISYDIKYRFIYSTPEDIASDDIDIVSMIMSSPELYSKSFGTYIENYICLIIYNLDLSYIKLNHEFKDDKEFYDFVVMECLADKEFVTEVIGIIFETRDKVTKGIKQLYCL